ncbi:MAG: hypothetical protein JJU11_03385 [Candidatus Sumerlaeia bacterium]|nr:hypothetical protein [Candidatus Sumerlaeia bacterium]
MKTRDFLFGGTAPKARRGKARNQGTEMPPLVGYRFIAIVVLIGACFAGLGFWRVNTVFTVRDYGIETHRLQELARERRDRETLLVARTSQLQRGEVLRSVAESSLGMSEPSPASIETLKIPAEVTERWLAASAGEKISLLEKEDDARR